MAEKNSKNPPVDTLSGIVRKYVDALTRDITDEVVRALGERLHKDGDAVGADSGDESSPAIPWVSPTYNPTTRRWGCPRCRNYSDLRKRGVTTHIRYCTGAPASIPHVVRDKFVPAVSKKSRKKKSP